MKIDIAILEETLESLDLIKVETLQTKELVKQWLSFSTCFIDDEQEELFMQDILHDQPEWNEMSLADIVDLISLKYRERIC